MNLTHHNQLSFDDKNGHPIMGLNSSMIAIFRKMMNSVIRSNTLMMIFTQWLQDARVFQHP